MPFHQRLVDEDEEHGDEDGEMEMSRAQIIYAQMSARGKHWPKAIGIVEIVAGFILVLLGGLEIFIIPMIESKDGQDLIVWDKRNCYGVGFIAGFVMVITGSTALRATMSKRNTTVNRFFNLTILSFLVYTALTILLIVAYSIGWTSPDSYEEGSPLKNVHMFVTIMSILGLIFASSALFQYVDVICCGRERLWVQWVRCFCPCLRVGVQKNYPRYNETLDVPISFNDPI